MHYHKDGNDVNLQFDLSNPLDMQTLMCVRDLTLDEDVIEALTEILPESLQMAKDYALDGEGRQPNAIKSGEDLTVDASQDREIKVNQNIDLAGFLEKLKQERVENEG